ncbi:MAG TPA: TIGR00725 family protein [bacterium]|jgi:hypothetical protein
MTDYSELRNKKVIAVCCGSMPSDAEKKLAYETGREVAKAGAILVCGGLGGSMEEACRGANEEGGITIGILPTYEKDTANDYVDIVIPTGLSHARNTLVVSSADGVIGVGGSWGTLSELSIAIPLGKIVVSLDGWNPESKYAKKPGIKVAETPEEAVRLALGM